jgi:UDP-N-acetylmuramate-alanine ligase
VGAEIPILGTNARWDSEGEYFVAEGDESDGTLINYHPTHAIVLNIEPEHLDFYKDLAAIDAVYAKLVAQTSGSVFFCGDDPGAQRVCSSHPRAISYGASPECGYRILDLKTENFRSRFSVAKDGSPLGEIALNIPGAHNAVNALAVIALATEIGVPFGRIAAALESFRGARRRFEIRYESTTHLLVDDYGHHPTAIDATISTVRLRYPGRPLVLAIEPLTYHRTAALLEPIAHSCAAADRVFVADIFAVRDTDLSITNSAALAAAIDRRGVPAEAPGSVEATADRIADTLPAGAVVLVMGGGRSTELATRLAKALEGR